MNPASCGENHCEILCVHIEVMWVKIVHALLSISFVSALDKWQGRQANLIQCRWSVNICNPLSPCGSAPGWERHRLIEPSRFIFLVPSWTYKLCEKRNSLLTTQFNVVHIHWCASCQKLSQTKEIKREDANFSSLNEFSQIKELEMETNHNSPVLRVQQTMYQCRGSKEGQIMSPIWGLLEKLHGVGNCDLGFEGWIGVCLAEKGRFCQFSLFCFYVGEHFYP